MLRCVSWRVVLHQQARERLGDPVPVAGSQQWKVDATGGHRARGSAVIIINL